MIGGTANTLQDAETLLAKEVDYINLGAFRAISSEADLSPVLGLHGYTLLVEALKTETPIIGFGGITIADVTALLDTGISGIAVSEEITSNFDTIKIYHQLLNASSTAEQRHTFE
jgi:thiamine-phosphate pyrophosphorylase